MRNPKAGNSYQAALLRMQLLSSLPYVAPSNRDCQSWWCSASPDFRKIAKFGNSTVLYCVSEFFSSETRIEKHSFLE